jgi:transposase-like protein
MATIVTRRVVVCIHCQSEAVKRNGHLASGYQRFLCKDCRATFSDAPPRQAPTELKEQVIAAYQERMSMRGVARVYKISRNTLTKWIKEKGGDCQT